jgi:hypothetical protein
MNELLVSHFQELTNSEPEALIASNEIDDSDEEEPARSMLTAKIMFEFLHKADEVAEMAIDMDHIAERRFTFERRLDELVTPYWEILKDFHKKSKQRKIIDYINPKSFISVCVYPELSTSNSNIMTCDA